MGEFDDVFQAQAEWARIYPATETETDPREHTVEYTQLKNRNIKAIITDLAPTQIQYKLPSINTTSAKEIIFEKKHLELFKASYRIEIDDTYYIGWRQNSKIMYRKIGDYIRAYIYKEQGA